MSRRMMNKNRYHVFGGSCKSQGQDCLLWSQLAEITMDPSNVLTTAALAVMGKGGLNTQDDSKQEAMTKPWSTSMHTTEHT